MNAWAERFGWHALHAVTRVALRLERPLLAKRVVDGIGGRLRPIVDVAEARRAARVLEAHGTCLSRALTLAARVPAAEVVFGVEPPVAGAPAQASLLKAHAWVELAREPLLEKSSAHQEIARLARASIV